jgi:hypothetical protein
LIDAGVKLRFDGAAVINIPSRALAPSADFSWVAEASPMPVLQFTLSALQLKPYKLAASAAASREFLEGSNGEQVIAALLKEDLAYSLDSTMLSATAGSTARPAGILNGVTGQTATTGGGVTAMNADVKNLFSAISAVGSIDDIALIASPAQAAALALQPRSTALKVRSSRALAAGTVVAVDTAGAPTPRIEASGNAVAHFDDTTPLAVSTAGSPNTVAAPLRSAFQTDCVIIRCILSASWVVRSGAVAMVTSTTW